MTATLIIAVNDPNIRYLLQRYAEESGFHAVGVSRGKDALAMLSQQTDVALIILDTEFRDTSGNKTRDKIRTESYARRIPVVIYSCLDEPAEDWPEGVTGYLPRSVMYDDFVAELERAGLSAGTESR